ncbi:histidine kinase dimerization/phosphoacceptor domain -containing protein [Methylobacterium sp. 77]|uniref:histidine kinase dimerization/phosphoacceptor domain -containing protein n=1 Tax=Methylobacterium sp. 77 TaxID=1101192 RepID=UPI000367AC51|nr:histidine kinase dimerization/phosphoacceptor domain -containing protein [Methylobacterium sp. 77]
MTQLRDARTADPAILASQDTDLSDLGPDLTVCDREPIHIPGAIQPHGVLLIANAEDQSVVGGAGDIEGLLAAEWSGRTLPDLLGEACAARLRDAPHDETAVIGPVTGRDTTMDAIARFQDGQWLIQLEPQASIWSDAASLLGWLDRAGGALERAADLKALCERAAISFRELTGFDRVMIYRFLDDDAGVVIAESRVPELGSFLHHHFPASDIPKQARALYIRNRVRVIPDVTYTPQPLRPKEMSRLDLSDIDLRSVSPIHLQYLRNMDVAASASISIVKDGILWGLVACHNSTPRSLAFGQRMACQALAGSLARQVRAREEAEDYRERLQLRSAEDVVSAKVLGEAPLADILIEASEDLRRMLGADGFALLQGRDLHQTGRCADEIDLREIAAWVRTVGGAQALHTHSLSKRFPRAAAYRSLASGLLAVVLSGEEPIILMWFRAERIEVVNWAGNPHKAANTIGGVLSPRASFEAWTEEVHGHAKPWTLPEIEAAQRIVRELYEARQTRRIRELNRELAATVADKESLLVQKDYLIKEVNHRVQNSLQLVSAFLALQARAEGNAGLSDALSEAQRRLAAVALVHRRLYSDDNVEMIDLARYLDDLVSEMKSSMGIEWAEQFSTDFAPIIIPTDSAVNIGLILTELVINANKYAYAGAVGPIAISLEQHRHRFRLIVADQGQGKTGTRSGFGTRMLNAMVDRLGGTIENTNNRPGLRVILTASIGAPEPAPAP